MILAELRVVPWSQVAVPAAVGGSLLALTSSGVMDGPQPGFVWLGLGALVLGACASLDDPSAGLTAACPVGRRARTVQRLLVAVLIAGGWCAFAASLDGVHQFSGTALALTGSGAVLATVAASDVLRRLGTDQPGAVVGGTALLLIVGCLILQPFGDVQVLQAYDDRGALPGLWTVVSLGALCLLAVTSADPARRPRSNRA
jgi:hypothetical protein